MKYEVHLWIHLLIFKIYNSAVSLCHIWILPYSITTLSHFVSSFLNQFFLQIILLKHLIGRPQVCPTNTIPQRGVLSIIEVESGMMETVACGAVDDGTVGDVLAVVDEDGPDLHKDEEAEVCELLQRKNEGE